MTSLPSVSSVPPWWKTLTVMVQSRGLMAQTPERPTNGEKRPMLYCPNCAREVADPLTCGDCSAVICRVCGTPLEMPEDLGIG